jgi:hypothetical protein
MPRAYVNKEESLSVEVEMVFYARPAVCEQ